MFHLHAFGNLRLASTGRNDSVVPLQGLSLAMLVILAVSAPRALNRDRLMALLWPDVDEQRASHRLTQLRYALRKALHADPITGTAELRLADGIISSDIQAFRDAVRQDELERALSVAEAPFLEGFHLRDNLDFGNWMEDARRDFHRQVDVIIERLARASETRGDAMEAARWLEAAVRRDPTDEAAAVKALAAYEVAGEPAQSRRLGDWLVRALREDYDAEPGGALQAALERARPAPASAVSARDAIPAIAVLPLRNVSPEPENEFFSDGMTDEIIGALSRVSGIRVVSRTSSYAFKGKLVDARHIAARLGVAWLVEGSVRKVGNRIRLAAQLVSAHDGCELWSKTFDRTMDDVFELQTELASAIVAALPLKAGMATSGDRKSSLTTDPETYTLYLKGRYWSYRRTIEGLQLAIEYFEQTVERDPDYALGWTGIAECQTLLGFPEFADLPPRQTMPRAKDAAARALRIAPDLAETHVSIGVLGLVYDWDWPAAESAMREALRLQPNHTMAETWYGMLLSALGRHEEAIGHVQHASALDPLALTIHLSLGRALYFARRFDEALTAVRAVAEIEPNYPHVHIWLARCYLALARFEEALRATEPVTGIRALNGYVDSLRATALIRLGRGRQVKCDQHSPYFFMVGAARSVDEGLAALDRCWHERIGHLAWVAVEPLCDPLRSDPRFAAFLKRMKLA